MSPCTMKLLVSSLVATAILALQWVAGFAMAQATSEPNANDDAKPPVNVKQAANALANPQPTLANVAYGEDPAQVLDFWKAESSTPTPLVFFIHGGGWYRASKDSVVHVRRYLAAGISVVSIEYRFVPAAKAAGIEPPVKWPLHDAARALQFVRSKAGEWNIDKTRIGASGGSAGGCSSLWLAFHDDMADPGSSDPIARESTRLMCASVFVAQTSLDPQQMKEWIPNIEYGGHAFGFGDPEKKRYEFAEFLQNREKILPWIQEYSPYAHVTSDDPPVYLCYKRPPAVGQKQKDPTHSANFGAKLQEKLQSVGVACELVYPDASDIKHPDEAAYLIDQLIAKP